jgi:AraC-like DNA-binding protein
MDYNKVEVVSKEFGKITFAQIAQQRKNTLSVQADGEFGSIIVDQIRGENQIIWRSRFNIKENTRLLLTLRDEVPGIRLIFTLKNNMHFNVPEFGKGTRLKDQYNLVYSPNADIEYSLKKGKEYETLVIFMRLEWLLRWKNSMPELNDFFKQVELNKPASLNPLAATTSMMNTILDILNNPDKDDYYVEGKVRDIIYQFIFQLRNSPRGIINLTSNDIKKLQKARAYLLKVVSSRCTIVELSEKVGLGGFKLKHGFKQLFGFTIHDFITQERMLLSIKLLKEADMDMKQIAKKTGYRSYSHFTTAFKKKFGYSPKSIKKKAA